MSHETKLYLMIFCILILSVKGQDRYFMISSYDENYEYSDLQISGIKNGLEKGGIQLSSLNYKTFYMDTVMTYPTEKETEKISDFVIQLIIDWKPTIVFVMGDTALESVAVKYVQMREQNSSMREIPFVFCGIYANITSKNYYSYLTTDSRAKSISGIAVPSPIQQKVDLSLKLFPNATRIAFLFDQSRKCFNDKEILSFLISNNQLNSSGLPIEMYDCQTFTIFQQNITTLQSNGSYAIIVMNAQKFWDSTNPNKTVLPHQISDWIISNVKDFVVGPISQGFSIDIRLNPNSTCSFAGIQGSKVLISRSKKVTDVVSTNSDSIFIDTNIRKSKFDSLLALSNQTRDYLKDPSFFLNARLYDPLFYINPIKIYIAHSYSQTWVFPIFEGVGIINGLEKGGFPRSSYYLKVFWMDTKDTYNTPSKVSYISSITLSDITAYRPSLIASTDDDSLRSVAIPYTQQNLNTTWKCPVVFSGINVDPSIYPLVGNLTKPVSVITGTLERYNYNKLIKLSVRINPSIKKVVILFDSSSSSLVLKAQIDEDIKKYSSQWPLTTSRSFYYYKDFQDFILKHPDAKETTLLVISTYTGYRNQDNTTVTGTNLIKWLNSHRNGTEVSQGPVFSAEGGFLSFGQDPASAGEIAGSYGARMLKGELASNLPIQNVAGDLLTINRQRLNFIQMKVPNDILVQTTLFESPTLPSNFQFTNLKADFAIGYLTFCLYLILGVFAFCLLLFTLVFKNSKSNQANQMYRKIFYISMVVLCIIRMFQLMVQLNVRPPDLNLIISFVLYKLGSIFYIALMMMECLLWIKIIRNTFSFDGITYILIIYCVMLMLVNTCSQIISAIVFSIFAKDAVNKNSNKIIATAQGYYFPKYGSIQEEIIQTTPTLKASSTSSQYITGLIGILHSFIFIIVGVLLMKTIMKSSQESNNKNERQRQIVNKIMILTVIIGLCSAAALIYSIILSTNSETSAYLWFSFLMELIIFELVPCFSLLFTYINSVRNSLKNSSFVPFSDSDQKPSNKSENKLSNIY